MLASMGMISMVRDFFRGNGLLAAPAAKAPAPDHPPSIFAELYRAGRALQVAGSPLEDAAAITYEKKRSHDGARSEKIAPYDTWTRIDLPFAMSPESAEALRHAFGTLNAPPSRWEIFNAGGKKCLRFTFEKELPRSHILQVQDFLLVSLKALFDSKPPRLLYSRDEVRSIGFEMPDARTADGLVQLIKLGRCVFSSSPPAILLHPETTRPFYCVNVMCSGADDLTALQRLVGPLPESITRGPSQAAPDRSAPPAEETQSASRQPAFLQRLLAPDSRDGKAHGRD